METANQPGRYLYPSIFAFLLGILLAHYRQELLSLNWAWSLALLIPLAVYKRIFWPVLCFVIGMVWLTLRAEALLAPEFPQHLERQTITVTGVIDSIPQIQGKSLKFMFDVESIDMIDDDGEGVAFTARVLLRWRSPEISLHVGERWQLTVRLKRPHGYRNAGSFDYEAWLFRRGIRAKGYVVSKYPAKQLAPASGYWLQTQRQSLDRFISTIIPDHPMRGVIKGLSLGMRSDISSEQWKVLRKTGTNHLLAISGLHIGLMAGIGFFLGRAFWRMSYRAKPLGNAIQYGSSVSIIFALTYSALAGFTIPTQRALIMLTIVLVTLLLRRLIRPGHSLMMALLIILIVDPLAVSDVGFWLSFIAVTMIIIFLYRDDSTNSNIFKTLAGWFHIQLVLAITLLPFVVAFFGQASIISPISNFFAIPLIGLMVVPLILFASLLFFIGIEGASSMVFELVARLLSIIWQGLEWFSNISWSIWTQHQPSSAALSLIVLGLVIMALRIPVALRAVGLFAFLPFLTTTSAMPTTGEFRVTVLDVGQGLSVVVKTSNHVLLYDTGARVSRNYNLGDAVVAPYLRAQGIEFIDTLVISHSDNDHIGGLHSIIDQFETGRRLTSDTAAVPGSQACIRGQQWHWDGVDFRVLSPGETVHKKKNDRSCVILIRSNTGSMLLTGDIGKSVERDIVDREQDQLKVDVLLVPHQGSKTSSSTELLNQTRPQLAVVATGYLNRYRHPAQSVMDRYRKSGIPVINTSEAGSVSIEFTDQGVVTERYLDHHNRYWYAQ